MSAYVDRSDEVQQMYADESDDVLAGMFNGAWLDTQEFPPLEYAVPGIIPEGFGLLVSPPKAGKSWLVCGIGLACATGGLALGRIHVEKRPVLYLALEDGQRRLQSRCRQDHLRSSLSSDEGAQGRSDPRRTVVVRRLPTSRPGHDL
jgi:RecA-family ATPase